MSEVDVLKNFGSDAHLRRKWLRMWSELGCRILCMPKWMQDIVLEDVNTAIRNRLAIMEMVQYGRKREAL